MLKSIMVNFGYSNVGLGIRGKYFFKEFQLKENKNLFCINKSFIFHQWKYLIYHESLVFFCCVLGDRSLLVMLVSSGATIRFRVELVTAGCNLESTTLFVGTTV